MAGSRRGTGRYTHGWVKTGAASAAKGKGGNLGTGGAKATTPRRVSPSAGAGHVAAPIPGLINHSQMTNAQKIGAAAMMHGTGSKQHKAAMKRYGGK